MFNILIRMIFSIGLLCLVSGCAPLNIKQGKILPKGSEKGVLAIGVTADDQLPNFFWKFRKIRANKSKSITFYTIYDPLIWEKPRGRLVLIELEEGDYEFYDWEVPLGPAPTAFFSIPFTIKKDQITYKGRVHLELDRALSSYKVSSTDHFIEDKEIIRKHIINMDDKVINNQLAVYEQCSDIKCLKPKDFNKVTIRIPVYVPRAN